MINQRNPQLRTFDPSRRLRLLHIGNKTRGSLGPAGQHPSQRAEQSRRRGSARIEKTLPVKMNRKWCWRRALLHEFLFTHKFPSVPRVKVFKRRDAENAEETQRRHFRVVFSALPLRSLRLCVEHTVPLRNLTHVPASDK